MFYNESEFYDNEFKFFFRKRPTFVKLKKRQNFIKTKIFKNDRFVLFFVVLKTDRFPKKR